MKTVKEVVLLLCVTLLLVSCTKNETSGDNKITNRENKIDYIEYTADDAFLSEELSREAYPQTLKAIPVCPTADSVYSGGGGESGWQRFYVDGNGTAKTVSMCRDPLCTHRNASCPAYMARSSVILLEADGKLYYFCPLEDGKSYGLAEYDPAAMTTRIACRMEDSGMFLGRVGRFLFYYTRPVIGQKDNGQAISEMRLYRYDILRDQAEYLFKAPDNTDFVFSEGYGGYLWYFTPGKRSLCRRDVNMKNEEKLISPGAPMLTYDLRGDEVFYIVREEDGQGGWGYGTLYRCNLVSGETEALYQDVTWFTLDGDTLYYTLYDPIPCFDWDIVAYDDEGEKKTEQHTIYTMNGNTVYRVPLDQAGKQGEAVPGIGKLAENGAYLGEIYRVWQNYLLVQVREAYQENGRNGMFTGYAAVDMESGEVSYFSTDIVMNR